MQHGQSSISGRKRIYLAGKIHPHDWRHTIVEHPDFYNWPVEHAHQHSITHGDWPVLPQAIFQRFDYVGPYFSGCGHGCYHGPSSHGTLPEGMDMTDSCLNLFPQFSGHKGNYVARPAGETWVIQQCLAAIAKADLVFAWIESADAFATLFELGYATGMGKVVIGKVVAGVGFNIGGEKQSHDDFWFIREVIRLSGVGVVGAIRLRSPREMLEDTLVDLGWFNLPDSYDSPIEQVFAEAWVAEGYHNLYPLAYQHAFLDGKYRLDFAYPPASFGIELDGYAYHNSPDQFTRDRQRQRELEADGWRIIRFSGREINADVGRCVEEAVRLLATHCQKLEGGAS